jgi:hypothetical protein
MVIIVSHYYNSVEQLSKWLILKGVPMSNAFEKAYEEAYFALLRVFEDKAPEFTAAIDSQGAFEMLASAATTHGYNQWVNNEVTPKWTTERPPFGASTSAEPFTTQAVEESFNRFMASLLCREWDIETPLWLARHLDPGRSGHYSELVEGETRIHPELAAIRVPTPLIDIYIQMAGKASSDEVISAKTRKEISTSLPCGVGPHSDGFRDALESMVLALEAEGVSPKVIAKSVMTALDAYANNMANDDEFDPAPASTQAG